MRMEIHTERLLIRPLRVSDAQPLAEMWADPEVTRYMGGPRDPEEVRRLLEEDAAEEVPETFDLWPVVERATGEVIGHCGLLDKEVDGRTEIELVYVLRRASWGRGYATEAATAIRNEAFGRLGVRRLIALIEPDNRASARVAIKAGLTLERETVRPGGEVRQVYALTNPAGPAKGEPDR